MLRSLFFVPANRSDLHAKLLRFRADAYVLDLEDGTPAADKHFARDQLGACIAGLRAMGLHGRLLVRVNAPASEHYLNDVAAVLASDADGLVIPKLEDTEELFPVLHGLQRRGTRMTHPRSILAGIESVRGVQAVERLLARSPLLDSLYFGAEDFVADLGGRRTAQGQEVLYARSRVAMAARERGVSAIDQAVISVRDEALYRQDAEMGRDLGFRGKICLTPGQIDVCHGVFSPSAEEVGRAQRMFQTHEEAADRGLGTPLFEGQRLEDGPLLRQARATLDTALATSMAVPHMHP